MSVPIYECNTCIVACIYLCITGLGRNHSVPILRSHDLYTQNNHTMSHGVDDPALGTLFVSWTSVQVVTTHIHTPSRCIHRCALSRTIHSHVRHLTYSCSIALSVQDAYDHMLVETV